MLIIQHSTGPLAGKEERIDPTLDRVVFGRTLSCQVVYPPEETIVAREHFALVRKPPGPAGHWSVELFGGPFVAINGVVADPNQALPVQAVFELGKHGGPSFTLTVHPDAATDNMPRTLAQEPQERPRILAVKAAQLARRYAAAGLLIATAAIAAGVYYAHQQLQVTISTDVRDRLARAAYYVSWPPGYSATAWPVGPHMLATNAHVVAPFYPDVLDGGRKLRPGQTMTVRSPGPNGKIYHVIDHKIHPGYAAFKSFMARYVDRHLGLGSGYDVGLLIVKEELPTDSILELASDEELNRLTTGSVLATAGYPGEGVMGADVRDLAAVAPELHVGTVTSMSDFFFVATDFPSRHLIHFDLPATGGASGSPVVGRTGHVVAILNMGNSFVLGQNQPRMPSGVLINYGQRVDVLRQLMSGAAERNLPELQKYWVEQAKNIRFTFVSGVITSALVDTWKKEVNLTPMSEVASNLSDGPVSNNGSLRRQKSHSVQVPTDSEYIIVAYSHDGSPITLRVEAQNQLLAEKADASPGWEWLRLAFFSRTAANTPLMVRIASSVDQPVPYTLAVYRVRTK